MDRQEINYNDFYHPQDSEVDHEEDKYQSQENVADDEEEEEEEG